MRSGFVSFLTGTVLATQWHTAAATCAPQGKGISHQSHDPDTAQGFLSDPYYATQAQGAITPNGFTQLWANQNESINGKGYLTYVSLTSFDTDACAKKCNSTSNCVVFNIYFERDPSVSPDSPKCQNPPSVTNIKCAMWSTALLDDNAATPNSGQWRGQFQTVKAGSNGYGLTSIVNPPPSTGGNGGQNVTTFTSPGNPILADGSLYSADPGPIVVNDTLYIISGQDDAPPDVLAFIMNDWVLFSSDDPKPANATWKLHHDFEQPEQLFKWAAPGEAYASQIVQGTDGRFYLYAPVPQSNFTTQDPFGIGVAVADQVTGPYVDLHPSGPIVSQSYPAPGDNIVNIDPTVYVDDDGKVYMYWGTFGALRGVQLESDMTTFASDVVQVTSLNGFFEASWLTKRDDTYYLIYADNAVGPDSPCTPTVYHACIAYGTAPSPLGPWTYQGVILGIVSSTTSHPGVVKVKDQWLLVYHTADAEGGGNFRRSVALDNLFFDDSQTPPTIEPVVQTFRPAGVSPATYDRGMLASVVGLPVCGVQYWVEAVHDLLTPTAVLPPQYWSTWNGPDGAVLSNLTYTWDTAQTLNGTSMAFFADHPAGSVLGVSPPNSWVVQYMADDGTWAPVNNHTAYPLDVTTTPAVVPFDAVTTKSLRAIMIAPSNGTDTAGVGVIEWHAFATTMTTDYVVPRA